MDGKAVYQSFRKEAHVAQSPIEPVDGREIIVGIDFGRTPSAIFTQQLHSGKWTIFHEIIGQDMGAGRFADVLKREINRHGWDKHDFKFIGDPAGNQMAQTSEQTPFMILRAAGIQAYPCAKQRHADTHRSCRWCAEQNGRWLSVCCNQPELHCANLWF